MKHHVLYSNGCVLLLICKTLHPATSFIITERVPTGYNVNFHIRHIPGISCPHNMHKPSVNMVSGTRNRAFLLISVSKELNASSFWNTSLAERLHSLPLLPTTKLTLEPNVKGPRSEWHMKFFSVMLSTIPASLTT